MHFRDELEETHAICVCLCGGGGGGVYVCLTGRYLTLTRELYRTAQ